MCIVVITKRRDVVKNNKASKLFALDIYCRVSHDTFSSARTFAVTLKDNGIAKIIGSPTGGKPNSFGMPKKFKTPNNEINFRVSQCLFLRPNKTEESKNRGIKKTPKTLMVSGFLNTL